MLNSENHTAESYPLINVIYSDDLLFYADNKLYSASQ